MLVDVVRLGVLGSTRLFTNVRRLRKDGSAADRFFYFRNRTRILTPRRLMRPRDRRAALIAKGHRR